MSTAIEPTTVLIEASKVDWPKGGAGGRAFSKERAAALAPSIKYEGLIHPIMVRSHPTEAGRYLGVVGKHRWYASHKLNLAPLIEAKVVEADDQEAALKTAAENLFRNALTPLEQASAMKLWQDAHKEQLASHRLEVETRKQRREEARAAREAAGKSGEEAPSGDAAQDEVQIGPPEGEKPAPPANFVKDAAEKMGVSPSTVKRIAAIGKAFDEDQLEILEQMSVNQVWTETIAKIKDKAQRDQIVALIAGGETPEKAIATVAGSAEVKRIDGKVTDTAASADDVMSDDEWVSHYCSAILSKLPFKAPFKADAILYRHTVDLRAVFRSKTNKLVEEAKKQGATAGLYGVLKRLNSLSHPKNWMVCGKCAGNGVVAGEATPCRGCNGAGYQTAQENRK